MDKKMKKYVVMALAFLLAVACGEDASSGEGVQFGNGTGTGGSLARFAVANDHLFAVDGDQLKVFNLNDIENPVPISNHRVEALVETVFPYSDSVLFIGTNSGMLIYDISKAPSIELISQYRHVVACDPVVANATHAYVTLRSERGNNFCNRSVNQLDVIDITDLRNPQVVREFPLFNPYGLGLYGDTLLVCDAGLKVFDVTNPGVPGFITADEDLVNARDLIPLDDLIIVTSTDGLDQYRFENGKLNYLSSL
jgi:hypothetical protein